MNILHLKYAVEIAKTKSISKAAENLYMGQPNLSRAIRQLEEELGITIFKRTSKGILLTIDGEEFLKYAKCIISQVEEVEELYKRGKKPKQKFTVCVPRTSYISNAFAEFSNHIKTDKSAEIYYKETNPMQTINRVVKGDSNLGIIRYQNIFDKYYRSLFNDKKLVAGIIADFSYVVLMSKEHPLAQNDDIKLSELAAYVEITHADLYVPSLSLADVRKEELSKYSDKHIYVYERGSQFAILEKNPNTFMFTSPEPNDLITKFGLIQKKCRENTRIHRDVLIYRKGYKLTELDNEFITLVCEEKRKYM
ncbi:LysR family transcriptional regulator [Anaerosacchariphilus polymeriproducens]|uniref:LysR family transcriptional regulator n=1 Tax=Anaerosacchariphilus polymeriproducens TaxID=1812858 RepID=A0A371AVW1_9FIRM|nr:LysR family transcriptional regulator [Anaerosacchariphilus polymeriproducens]RDU23672.1 LysR family transcriptional regulator [Anaerosacchariphilus polymeriproducens]